MTDNQISLSALIQELDTIRKTIISRSKAIPAGFFDALHPNHRDSARNLVHYLCLRTFDLRPLQEQLTTLGISSISHPERFTLVNLDNVLHILHLLKGESIQAVPAPFTFDYPKGKKQLQKNTNSIFGTSDRFGARIMVTMPTEASTDYILVKKLIEAGMDIARINCSHDTEMEWKKMTENIRKATAELHKNCLVYMDLPGPKLRTGEVNPKLAKKKKKKNKLKPAGITLFKGDILQVHKADILGEDAHRSALGMVLEPAKISTTLPEIFEDVKVNDPIWFDDGKIGGHVVKVSAEKFDVLITQAKPKGNRLRADKGINLPETDLTLPPLTPVDLEILPFACQYADIVGYSFVRKPEDVHLLQRHLKQLGREDIAIVLKIETQDAFNNLPALLFAAMQSPHFGVMIARGDLAIEVGFTRIAEVQEQILWICDAAHVPIIWATQVLENLAKEGIASRAEITDAAMSVRAECVMLNKGPYIIEALQALSNINDRMVHHQFKKQDALRPLNIARHFFSKNQL